MKTIENRGISQVLVELTTLDLANLISYLNIRANVKAVEETKEGDIETSLHIYESYSTKIGGITLALIECLSTGELPQSVYSVDAEEYVYLLANQAK